MVAKAPLSLQVENAIGRLLELPALSNPPDNEHVRKMKIKSCKGWGKRRKRGARSLLAVSASPRFDTAIPANCRTDARKAGVDSPAVIRSPSIFIRRSLRKELRWEAWHSRALFVASACARLFVQECAHRHFLAFGHAKADYTNVTSAIYVS